MTTLRVLGVDPGLTRCGIGVVDALGGRRAKLVHAGVIVSTPASPLDQRLLTIARGLRAVLEEFAPDTVAVERVFSQNNISTVMGTAQVSGIALLEAAERGIPVALHTPSEVKAAVTGSGRADKKQIQTMLIKLLGLDAAPQPADASDAVAIALTQLWRGPGPVALDSGGGARTSAQAVWARAEREARRARERSSSRH
ncbi:MAG: crossover junction endodeoxyribonuclease RuvC [Brachybacterium sp.]|uniref:crossover junction endodeoxyribonuclease RuvC n=1 Tax=unclassified Brachybacterium TaxID=2623841 RepID=UPI003F93B483